MDAVFSRLMEVSGEGSVIVLAVLALRLVLRRAPRRTVCLLWMLAVLRLLVPFKIESDWSLQPEQEVFAPPVVQEDYFDSGTAQTPIIPEYLENAVEYPLDQPTVPEKVTVADILPWLWLLGAGLLAVHGAVSYVRLKGRIRDAVVLEEGVWLCPGLDTAFVLGFFRPQIYLPVLDEEERELVLRHERCHIRRLDHWWKLAAYAAVSIHWFNPLAWVTYVLLCRDMELACDQDTVRGMDNAQRRAYSAALLNCAARRSGIAACPVAFGEISVKERIKMVLHYRKPGFWVTLVALIAAVAVGVCLLTSPKELTDLEKCQQALEKWQGMEAYCFHESQSNVGDMAENEWSVVDYWSCDGEHLMRFSYAEGLGFWQNWKNGKSYIRDFGSADAQWSDTGWHETESQENVVIPWVMRLDWEELTVHGWESADDGKTVLLMVDLPTLGPGTMSFHFDEAGELRSVSRTFTQPSTTVISGTIELKETDRTEIRQEMDYFDVTPELLLLYGELEALQKADSVHLVIDQQIESDYPGWETCRQEFLYTGDRFYRNFDYQSAAGPYTTSYLEYGNAVYAREYSDAGVVPNRDWARIQDKSAGELTLLNLDWTRFEVLSIVKNEDGSTVITMQGDLNPTADTVYHEKTYEFHLDLRGNLTTQIVRYHTTKQISDGFAQGTFAFRGQDTVHILNTPREELTERILEVTMEVLDYRSTAQKTIPK